MTEEEAMSWPEVLRDRSIEVWVEVAKSEPTLREPIEEEDMYSWTP